MCVCVCVCVCMYHSAKCNRKKSMRYVYDFFSKKKYIHTQKYFWCALCSKQNKYIENIIILYIFFPFIHSSFKLNFFSSPNAFIIHFNENKNYNRNRFFFLIYHILFFSISQSSLCTTTTTTHGFIIYLQAQNVWVLWLIYRRSHHHHRRRPIHNFLFKLETSPWT